MCQIDWGVVRTWLAEWFLTSSVRFIWETLKNSLWTTCTFTQFSILQQSKSTSFSFQIFGKVKYLVKKHLYYYCQSLILLMLWEAFTYLALNCQIIFWKSEAKFYKNPSISNEMSKTSSENNMKPKFSLIQTCLKGTFPTLSRKVSAKVDVYRFLWIISMFICPFKIWNKMVGYVY